MNQLALPIILLLLSWGFWASADFKEIAAGVAIFLFGMLALERGFGAFTGGVLERILQRTTDRLWKSVSFGIATTTLMQSSSLVSVITISFLSAGLITLSAGIGVIFGANLGTTTGAWLIAGFGLKVDIAAFAMPMLVFGVIGLFHKGKILPGLGNISAGLGFLFLGIHFMKSGFEAFRETIDLTAFAVQGYPGLVLFAVIGVAATVIMQSSHATLVLIITGLAAGQVTYENALALAIGANIGTTITAIIGAMGSTIDGKRLAAAHLIFNGVTAVIAIAFIHPIAMSVDWIAAAAGIADDNYTLKLAVFHTVFNVIGVVVMIPFTRRLAAGLVRWMPARDKQVHATEPIYLHEASLDVPLAALEGTRKEIIHLYDNCFAVIAHALYLDGADILGSEPLENVVARSREVTSYDIDLDYAATVKMLYNAIVDYVSRAQPAANPEQSEQFFALRLASRDVVESVKAAKHLQKNLTLYLNSDTATIRDEYDRIRVRIARVMSDLHKVRLGRSAWDDEHSQQVIKQQMRAADRDLNTRVESHIREGRLTPTMATSLMNDSGYAYEIAKNLGLMAEAVFKAEPVDLQVLRETARMDAIVVAD